MVVLHSHSRVGGNNRAHFEPETVYIVTVGSVPSLLGVELHRHTDASNHTRTHPNTHAQTHIAVVWKDLDFVYLSGGAGCSPLLWLSLENLLMVSVWFTLTQGWGIAIMISHVNQRYGKMKCWVSIKSCSKTHVNHQPLHKNLTFTTNWEISKWSAVKEMPFIMKFLLCEDDKTYLT